MSEHLLLTDLDNTLLYSYKHRLPGDVCVEYIHEKEQGYMSVRSLELLGQVIRRIPVIPVTTRSVEQYQRIHFPEGACPETAVVSNGAILLKNGVRDPEWDGRMSGIIAPCREEMYALCDRYSSDPHYIRCRIVDDSYLFVYCAKDADPEACARELSLSTDLRVQVSGKKIYILPPDLHKGTAVRLMRQYEPGKVFVSAGDSIMDADMLRAADIAIYPKGLELPGYSGVSVLQPLESRLSDFMLDQVLTLCKGC